MTVIFLRFWMPIGLQLLLQNKLICTSVAYECRNNRIGNLSVMMGKIK